MSAEYAERVARGAALIDKKVPGWDERIKVTRLNMQRSDRCVLGQTFGSYLEGYQSLRLRFHGDRVDCGFYRSGDTAREWRSLQAAWRALILERRAMDGAPSPSPAAPSPAEQGQ